MDAAWTSHKSLVMAAETRSYDRASVLMKRTLGHGLSPKAFERLTR